MSHDETTPFNDKEKELIESVERGEWKPLSEKESQPLKEEARLCAEGTLKIDRNGMKLV